MARCDFCGTLITKGKGKMYVKKDATILNFCSSKCEKNLLKLKRKPRTTAWTMEYVKDKKVRLSAGKDAKPGVKPAPAKKARAKKKTKKK